MKLSRDTSAGAYAVQVPCETCGKMVTLAHTVIDFDGKPFTAYYCGEGCLVQAVSDRARAAFSALQWEQETYWAAADREKKS
jgi:lysyl-tRNA synthetase class I